MPVRQTYLTAGLIGLALVIAALILSGLAHLLDGDTPPPPAADAGPG